MSTTSIRLITRKFDNNFYGNSTENIDPADSSSFFVHNRGVHLVNSRSSFNMLVGSYFDIP